jgi:hypothetical protein
MSSAPTTIKSDPLLYMIGKETITIITGRDSTVHDGLITAQTYKNEQYLVLLVHRCSHFSKKIGPSILNLTTESYMRW